MSGRIPSTRASTVTAAGARMFLTLVHNRAPNNAKTPDTTFTRWPDVLNWWGKRTCRKAARTPSYLACIIVKSAGLSIPFDYLISPPHWHLCASPYLPSASQASVFRPRPTDSGAPIAAPAFTLGSARTLCPAAPRNGSRRAGRGPGPPLSPAGWQAAQREWGRGMMEVG